MEFRTSGPTGSFAFLAITRGPSGSCSHSVLVGEVGIEHREGLGCGVQDWDKNGNRREPSTELPGLCALSCRIEVHGGRVAADFTCIKVSVGCPIRAGDAKRNGVKTWGDSGADACKVVNHGFWWSFILAWQEEAIIMEVVVQ